MNVKDMTKKDFKALPYRDSWDKDIGEFNSLVILPTGKRYDDLDYQCMDFVAVKNGEAICRLSGYSDVIHIDGIGGYGKDWYQKGRVPSMIEVKAWSIDCLHKSGLLQIFVWDGKLTCGAAISSFELWATKNVKPK